MAAIQAIVFPRATRECHTFLATTQAEMAIRKSMPTGSMYWRMEFMALIGPRKEYARDDS